MMRLRRALLRWVLAAVAVPVAAEVADRLGRRLEATRGTSSFSRALRKSATRLRGFRPKGQRA